MKGHIRKRESPRVLTTMILASNARAMLCCVVRLQIRLQPPYYPGRLASRPE
jgi:hypothetical protein